MRRLTLSAIGILAMAGVGMTGCAGPQQNAMLEEAQAAYAAARNDSQITANAPELLNEAGESLQQAERLWQEKADTEEVTHQAYLARQKTGIAREAAQLKQAEESIAEADTLRKQVLLDIRSKEAEVARQQAERQEQLLARQEAESRQQELENLRRETEERTQEAEAARQQATQLQQQAEMARQEAASRTEELQQLESELADLQGKQTPRGIVVTLKDIVFEVDKAELLPGSERSLEKIAQFLREHPERSIAVEGFTDSTGPEEYNRELSERRAQAVAEALTALGIRAERIQVRGYGEGYPVASNATAAGRQLNRRVEIIIANGTERISMQPR